MIRARASKLRVAVIAALAAATVAATAAAETLVGRAGTWALVGGTVHPVSAPAIANGTVVIENGRIAAVGAGLAAPAGATVVDCRGKHVYPGLVAANTQVGLVEINTIEGANDTQETGNVNPNQRAEVMFHPESDLVPVTRLNGVTSVLSVPGGGAISGTSALMHLDGWTQEDMTVRAPVGLHVRWPNMTPVRAWWNTQSDEEQTRQRDQAIDAIRRAFDDARAWQQAKAAERTGGAPKLDADPKWEAMGRALKGEIPVLIHADRLNQIRAALEFVDQQKLGNVVLVGGYDAPLVADDLKARNIAVIVAGLLAMPLRRDESYDAAFTVPARLASAGVRFCIADEGGSNGAANARNLPYHAGMAAAFGLPREEALKAVTLYPAQILGAADRVGTIEVGKSADVQVTSGDPLEITTTVERVFIAGRDVPMVSRQTRLYEKYDARPRGPNARKR